MSFENTPSPEILRLNDLYQEIILDHSKNPRFKGKNPNCRFCREGTNPLCGDALVLYCQVDGEAHSPRLKLSFDGRGCSISQASASMMCELLQGVSLEQAKKTIQMAEEIYTGKKQLAEEYFELDLEALYGVSRFPVRVKCAALCWKTLELLLEEYFDAKGQPKLGCDVLSPCPKLTGKKLNIVTTE